MERLILPSFYFTTYFSIAQTGPGGVGNADGSNGQPTNVLWLRANSGVSSSGGLVDTWVDQSGNNNSALGAGATRPTFNVADVNFNGLSSITFPNTAGLNYYLQVRTIRIWMEHLPYLYSFVVRHLPYGSTQLSYRKRAVPEFYPLMSLSKHQVIVIGRNVYRSFNQHCFSEFCRKFC